MPPLKPPVRLDNNILMNIDNGRMAHAEAEIISLQRDGHEVLLPPAVEDEFLRGQGFKPQDAVRREGLLRRLGLKVDRMANQVPMQQLRAWRDEAIRHGLSIPDATIAAQVKASGQARGIRNPVFLTKETLGTRLRMRQRGVEAVDFRAPPAGSSAGPEAQPSPPATPVPKTVPKVVPKPRAGIVRPRLATAKLGMRAGLRGLLAAENIASLIPDVILAVADRVAAREAIRRIQVKFLKEGFAKGVAAGAMGWTEEEMKSTLKNRITPFRVQGLGDPAGLLNRACVLQLAEIYENYAVEVGFQFSSSKTFSWKQHMRGNGFSVLHKYGYHFGKDPAALFEYDFIDKLAWVLRPATDAIVGPAIRFRQVNLTCSRPVIVVRPCS